MAFIMSRFDVGDYHAWKQMFDSDPGGRKQSAKGHRIFRSVANPNEVFVATEFSSAGTRRLSVSGYSRRERWTTSR
jgi:hypothetical protein